MGRTALLVVMAIAMVFGILGVTLRGSSRDLLDIHSAYFRYTNARNLARTAIHRYLRYTDGIPGHTGAAATAANVAGGSYDITTSSVADTLWLESTGAYEDTTYQMNVKLLFTPKPFPKAEGAISIAATPAEVNWAGNAWVDGHNYNAAGTGLVGWGDMPGIALKNPADSADIANNGVGHIGGVPPVASSPTLADPGAFIDEYEQAAHYLFNTPGNVAGNWTFGNSTNPVIVICNAGADTNFSIRFTGNIVGYGILAINGNVKFSGGINWYGLIVAYGQNNIIDFQALGTPQIVGGVIVAGNAGATLTLKGTGAGGKVKYSSEALDKARRIGRLLYYSVIEWYE